jgi:amino acid transporter
MLTAAITAAITAIAGLFGIKPGAWIAGVAVVVKLIIVGVTLVFSARYMKKRGGLASGSGKATQEPPPPADPPGT